MGGIVLHIQMELQLTAFSQITGYLEADQGHPRRPRYSSNKTFTYFGGCMLDGVGQLF